MLADHITYILILPRLGELTDFFNSLDYVDAEKNLFKLSKVPTNS